MPEYTLTNKALEDLSALWNFTCDKWTEEQADQYYTMLTDRFIELALHPEQGRVYAEISGQVLGSKAGRHIIFYRQTVEGQIEIIRILHERMDLKNRMSD